MMYTRVTVIYITVYTLTEYLTWPLGVALQVVCVEGPDLSRDTVFPMHPSSIQGVEDMSTLAELHEAAIMHNLFLRYQKDLIYVSRGPPLT